MSAVSASSSISAPVPYNPHLPQVRSFAQAADLAARKRIEASQLDLPPPTGLSPVRHSEMFFTPPEGLNTDPYIGVEIFRPETDEKKPMIIFSHGMGADPVEYRALLKELASHGHTVLSILHPSTVEDLPLSIPEERARADRTGYVVANNIEYVLDQVRNGALRGVGNADKIVLAGHSLGGAASINVARKDAGVAKCINLDGFLHGDAKTAEVKQPLLMMIGDYQAWLKELRESPEEEMRDLGTHVGRSLENYDTLRRNSPNSEKIMIPGGTHMDFSDAPFRALKDGKKSLDEAMRVHTIASQKILEFVNSAANRRCCNECCIL